MNDREHGVRTHVKKMKDGTVNYNYLHKHENGEFNYILKCTKETQPTKSQAKQPSGPPHNNPRIIEK